MPSWTYGDHLSPPLIDDLSELRIWFVDSELSRPLSSPSDTWFKYVTTGDDAHCWVAMHCDDIIAEVQVDRDGAERGYLGLAVRPDLWGREVSAAVLSAFLSGPGRTNPQSEQTPSLGDPLSPKMRGAVSGFSY